jgi:hypothetical protein
MFSVGFVYNVCVFVILLLNSYCYVFLCSYGIMKAIVANTSGAVTPAICSGGTGVGGVYSRGEAETPSPLGASFYTPSSTGASGSGSRSGSTSETGTRRGKLSEAFSPQLMQLVNLLLQEEDSDDVVSGPIASPEDTNSFAPVDTPNDNSAASDGWIEEGDEGYRYFQLISREECNKVLVCRFNINVHAVYWFDTGCLLNLFLR